MRIAELMKEHEHGVLATTKDKLLIDFVTRTTKRPDSKALREKYPAVYTDVLKTSESRKLKVRIEAGVSRRKENALLCEFKRLIYPKSALADDTGYRIALYRPARR